MLPNKAQSWIWFQPDFLLSLSATNKNIRNFPNIFLTLQLSRQQCNHNSLVWLIKQNLLSPVFLDPLKCGGVITARIPHLLLSWTIHFPLQLWYFGRLVLFVLFNLVLAPCIRNPLNLNSRCVFQLLAGGRSRWPFSFGVVLTLTRYTFRQKGRTQRIWERSVHQFFLSMWIITIIIFLNNSTATRRWVKATYINPYWEGEIPLFGDIALRTSKCIWLAGCLQYWDICLCMYMSTSQEGNEQ